MLPPDAVAGWAGAGPLALAGDAAVHVGPYLGAEAAPNRLAIDPAILGRIAGRRETGPAPSPFYLRPPDAIPAKPR
jgi:hypothetical protein